MSLDPRDIAVEPAAGVSGVPSAKGTSLGYDAWRRLRRRRMAMLSLGTLITIALLAFFTPLLPLSAPDKHHTELQYEPPKLSPLFVKTFSLNWQAIEGTSSKLRFVYSDLAAARQHCGEVKTASADDNSKEVK